MIILGKESKKREKYNHIEIHDIILYFNKQICVCMLIHVCYMCMDLYVFLHINLTKYNKNELV